MHREAVAQLINMGDDKNEIKIILHHIDGLNQTPTPILILCAKALINEEGAKLGSGAAGQHLREGHTQRKIDAETFAAAVKIIGARAKLIRNIDVERLSRIAGLGRTLRLERDMHTSIGHTGQQTIGFQFEFGQRRLDHHSRDALFAEGCLKLLIQAPRITNLIQFDINLLQTPPHIIKIFKLLARPTEPLIGFGQYESKTHHLPFAQAIIDLQGL